MRFSAAWAARKSIVLYDNLIKDMNTQEITAVLAHEVGHYKKKHVLQSMVISVAQMGIMFFIFGWLAGNPLMAEVLGAKTKFVSLIARYFLLTLLSYFHHHRFADECVQP